jgi:hypothetical protein
VKELNKRASDGACQGAFSSQQLKMVMGERAVFRAGGRGGVKGEEERKKEEKEKEEPKNRGDRLMQIQRIGTNRKT